MILSPRELEGITGIADAGKAQFDKRRRDTRKSARLAVIGRGIVCRQKGDQQTATGVRVREMSSNGASWISRECDAPFVGEVVLVGFAPHRESDDGLFDPAVPVWVACEVIRRQSFGEGRYTVGVCFKKKAAAPDLREYETKNKPAMVSATRIFSSRTGEEPQARVVERRRKPVAGAAARNRAMGPSSAGRARKSDQAELDRLRRAVLG